MDMGYFSLSLIKNSTVTGLTISLLDFTSTNLIFLFLIIMRSGQPFLFATNFGNTSKSFDGKID